MTLLVLIAAFLIEMFWQKLHELRKHQWINDYHDRWLAQIGDKHLDNEWVRIAVVLLPPVILLTILLESDQESVGFLLQWCLSVVVLVWSLGPIAIADKAIELANLSNDDSSNDPSNKSKELLIYGHRSYFSIVVWFVLAGPVAAMSYRLIYQVMLPHQMESNQNDSGDKEDDAIRVAKAWKQLFDIADFIPSRITAFLFLLTGDFLRGVSIFQSQMTNISGERIVSETGFHSVSSGDDTEGLNLTKELLERSLMLLLVMVAVISVFAS